MDFESIVEKTKREWKENPEKHEVESEVISKYGDMFNPRNIDNLTVENFKSFLNFKNNKHWSRLERLGPEITKDMKKLKKTLRILLDETIPINERLKQIRDKNSPEYHKGFGTKIKKSNNKSISTYKKFKLKDLISNDKNSIQYFNNLRWKEKKKCPRCGCHILYNINPKRYGCKKCRYKFSNFTGTYLGKLRIKPSLITHLLHLFASEQSAYTISKRLKCHISTIERAFRVFRQTIYDNSLQHIHQKLKLYRNRTK